MKDWLAHYATPWFMLVFAAGMLVYAHHSNNEALSRLADAIGGGGLTLLTTTAKQTNQFNGGPVTIDQKPETQQ